ncbi:alpha-hydroxy acid oxidase [Actinomadura oligospora]|uniref:alpha-hydroxy acid oxidase n=1 Tax=Actinomadura oligospora TaxID=111804 RepID=UPI00047ABDB7|nr:alpha-hydroxy acid oxidase [Actinomadura oligospora]
MASSERTPDPAAELERAAAGVLPRDVWDFAAGGSGRELALRANRAALDEVFLQPRVMRDVSGCSTGTTLLGRPARVPLAVAPFAYHRLFHPDGELATARAAKAAGVPFVLGTLSSVAVEEVTAAGGEVWFQLYWLRDEQRSLDLVKRAEDAGCRAVVLTADVPWMGRRHRDARNGFTLPDHVRAAHLEDTGAAHQRVPGASAVALHSALALSPALTWRTLETLCAATGLPVVLKGVLDPRDARRAADLGAAAVVVSNHGGRQLDGAVPGAVVLPRVAEAVAGRCEVLLDGAVRTGTDMLKALALGASGALVGRPVIWGLAVDGEDGVRRVLDTMAEEFRDALGLAGCATTGQAHDLTTVRMGTD